MGEHSFEFPKLTFPSARFLAVDLLQARGFFQRYGIKEEWKNLIISLLINYIIIN